MTTKTFNKLVRDKIPAIIKEKGKTCKFHVADSKEYRQKLKEKLLEESQEFFENPCVEELADLQEVMEALQVEYEWTSLRAQREYKKVIRGSFEKKIILEEVSS